MDGWCRPKYHNTQKLYWMGLSGSSYLSVVFLLRTFNSTMIIQVFSDGSSIFIQVPIFHSQVPVKIAYIEQTISTISLILSRYNTELQGMGFGVFAENISQNDAH